MDLFRRYPYSTIGTLWHVHYSRFNHHGKQDVSSHTKHCGVEVVKSQRESFVVLHVFGSYLTRYCTDAKAGTVNLRKFNRKESVGHVRCTTRTTHVELRNVRKGYYALLKTEAREDFAAAQTNYGQVLLNQRIRLDSKVSPKSKSPSMFPTRHLSIHIQTWTTQQLPMVPFILSR